MFSAIQLDYFLGLASINLETFLGFSLVLGYCASSVDSNISCILDSSVGSRVSEPERPGAGVFGWSRSPHFGPAPAPPLYGLELNLI